jgi:radical SAM protein (TIGR01212 family)
MDSFVPEYARLSQDVSTQLAAGQGRRGTREPYIAYLQAGTATHAPPEDLRRMLDSIAASPGAAGLFIGTRPDCVDEEVIEAIRPYLYRKLVWLELGLQSANDKTLELIGRGHDSEAFVRARQLAAAADIPVLAHVILGLPGEDEEKMMATANFLADLRVEGVKIHHLQVIQNTELERMYKEKQFDTIRFEDYPRLVTNFLRRLPPETVIHRLLADAPEDLLIAPRWPARSKVIDAIRDHMSERGTWQGRLYQRENREATSI